MARSQDGVYQGFYAPHLNPATSQGESRQTMYTQMYQRILMELATNRFKWHNLPSSISERFLELELMKRGLAVFFHDEKYGYLALSAMPQKGYNMYDDPIAFRVQGNRFVNKTVEATECVPIWANYLRQPDWDIIELYSSRLAELERTREITAKNSRQTRIVFADEDTRQSMANISRQIDAGQTTVYATDALNPGNITAIDQQIHPETLPKMAIERSQVWNDCMTLLGINNANQDKRERLVSDEVSANDEQIMTFKMVALNARKQAAEEINNKFGLEISVEFAAPDELHKKPGTLDTEAARMESLLSESEHGDDPTEQEGD